jgi:hypothetical protein
MLFGYLSYCRHGDSMTLRGLLPFGGDGIGQFSIDLTQVNAKPSTKFERPTVGDFATELRLLCAIVSCWPPANTGTRLAIN